MLIVSVDILQLQKQGPHHQKNWKLDASSKTRNTKETKKATSYIVKTHPHFFRFTGLSIFTATLSLILLPVVGLGWMTSCNSGCSDPPGIGSMIT